MSMDFTRENIHQAIRDTAAKYRWKKYYMLHRPVAPGAVPTSGMMDFINYEARAEIHTGHGTIWAWAEVYYERELTDLELKNYEMEES